MNHNRYIHTTIVISSSPKLRAPATSMMSCVSSKVCDKQTLQSNEGNCNYLFCVLFVGASVIWSPLCSRYVGETLSLDNFNFIAPHCLSQCIPALLKLLAQVWLSVSQAKCAFAMATVPFLSRAVGQGCVGKCKVRL